MVSYRCLAAVLSACFYVAIGQHLMHLKFRKRVNVKMRIEDVDKVLSATGLTQCLALCKKMSLCETASWSAGICLTSQHVKIHETNTAMSALVMDTNWTTMLRVVYPVFLKGGYVERHSLTFEEGKAKCEVGGTTIASKQDMLDARAMGFGLCVCGWLSDGTKAFVLQKPSVCTPLWSEGIIYGCGFTSTADVYCKA